MSDNQLNKPQRTVDSLKLLQDWSKWLIGLEAIVCMSLWPKLASKPAPSVLMYAGWMMFWASIIIAAILLLAISFFVRRVDTSADREMKKVWVMVGKRRAFSLGCFVLPAPDPNLEFRVGNYDYEKNDSGGCADCSRVPLFCQRERFASRGNSRSGAAT